MSDKLGVGFYSFTPDTVAAAPAPPGPGNFTIVTGGGPRTESQVLREIDACEFTLRKLRDELTWIRKQAKVQP